MTKTVPASKIDYHFSWRNKMVSYLVNNAGTSAYLAAGFAIISFAALFIFFAGVTVFGPINDFLSIFQMLFLIPVALALYQLLRSTAPTISLLTTAGAVLPGDNRCAANLAGSTDRDF